MNHEVSPPQIRKPDGSPNERVLNDQFGIGIEEANQRVQFGNYTGTVLDMLSDRRCPVGDKLHTTYLEAGIDGVVKQLEALSAMDPNFRVEITPQTLERNYEKKN